MRPHASPFVGTRRILILGSACVCFLLMLLGGSPPAAGTSFVMISDEDLADSSELVARVRVLSVAPSARAGRPYTDYRVRLERV